MEPQYKTIPAQNIYTTLKKLKLFSPDLAKEIHKYDNINQEWDKLFKQTDEFILKYCSNTSLN